MASKKTLETSPTWGTNSALFLLGQSARLGSTGLLAGSVFCGIMKVDPGCSTE